MTAAERIRATYLLETPLALEEAAEALAGEQSSGTFLELPGETDELRERFRAVVESVESLDEVDEPSLPGARPPPDGRYRRGRIVVSWLYENVGPNLPTLVTTVCGNLSELRELSGLRLLDLELPAALGDVGRGLEVPAGQRVAQPGECGAVRAEPDQA